ncbi:MAG: AAA family ATPase, partial [Bacteroidales bacterium]|nr:AAA family ATPase [Bacteroidales bacterium]
MLHYFLQLPKDYDLTFEKNIGVSKAIMYTAQNAFTPFYQYLDTTIKAFDRKEDIKATWTKVKKDNLVELKIIGSLYEIPKTTKIKLLNIEKGIYSIEGDFEKDFDIPLIIWNNKQKIKINLSEQNFISENRIKLEEIYENIEKANWAGDDVEIKPTWITVKQTDKIIQENKQVNIISVKNDIVEVKGILNKSKISINGKQIDFEIIEVSEQPQNTKLIKEEIGRYIVYDEKQNTGQQNFKLFNLLNKENISFDDGTIFNAENTENLVFKINDKSIIGKKVICDNVKFTISELRNKDKNQFWTQLYEIGEEKEDIPGFSPLKYFFDDDISIKDDKDNEYTVAQGNESEYKLILREKNSKRYNSFVFPKGKELQVRVNTYQLRKQLEAVLTLQKMPVGEHSNLIKLFEKREVVKWNEADNEFINDWIILTDENRSGSAEQREFVKKALSTPDFAILEGPPGSGKTTVILELICQLAKQGKRVLLCGSTHVAIDNVLERLKEKDDGQPNLIERFNILPVRIGDENRINVDIREFQIDNLQKEHNISENLLLDTANLVCGTTIGILQHPKFKTRKIGYYKNVPQIKEPIVPEFDYLIIDESSKTTFQEFLVPGLYAKKWILAGDVMQLSPFTDREQIVSNLDTLPLKQGTLPKEYQQATFYLHKLLEITRYAKNKFILPVSSKVIDVLTRETAKRNLNKDDKKFFVITQK